MYLEKLHPKPMELGLERVSAVWQLLGRPAARTTFTVAGTNGKGSTVACLDALLRESGHTVAAYTSPHLRRFNERLCINGAQLSDPDWCSAFEAVDAARGSISLTYFEFATLAALWLIRESEVEVQILEVGLGGRLDAVNIADADVAVITTIALDHQAWLGESRDAIAAEKAGILRRGKPLVCGDDDPPDALKAAAKTLQVRATWRGRDFDIAQGDGGESHYQTREGLQIPLPALPTAQWYSGAANALAAMQAWQPAATPDSGVVARALSAVRLSARCELIPGRISLLLDVAHNEQAAQALAVHVDSWQREAGGRAGRPRVLAVFSALRDKPIHAMCLALAKPIHAWYVGGLEDSDRGLSATDVISRMPGALTAQGFATVGEAWLAARKAARNGDLLVVFGSFLTVAKVLEVRDER